MWELKQGDCIEVMSNMGSNTIDLIVTSPPYNIRSGAGASWNVDDWYDDDMPEHDYQEWQKKCISEMLRLLKPNGVLCYNHKVRQKNKRAIHPLSWLPLEYLYQEIIWDRKSTHNHCSSYFHPIDERIYILCKNEPGFVDNLGFQTIWRFHFHPTTDHPAPFPPALPEICIKAFTRKGDVVLDPFAGSGTTIYVAEELERDSVGIELSEDYCKLIKERMSELQPRLFYEGVQ